jgi:glycosyltransferase involved in cell wall biosynthesis
MKDGQNEFAPKLGAMRAVQSDFAPGSEDILPSRFDKPVVIIPAYKPASGLTRTVRALLASGAVQRVVVVDDGSGPESRSIFCGVGMIDGTHLLVHAENRGKGAALKTGFNFAMAKYPAGIGVVTADADGQHYPEDIIRVAREFSANPAELVLGVRNFDGKVPARSRLGNVLTRRVLHMLTGRDIIDTQTGLRGIPASLIPALMNLRTNRYDFELDMLLTSMQSGRNVRPIEIQTVYEDGNRTSHFNPVIDSVRVYLVFARFIGALLL